MRLPSLAGDRTDDDAGPAESRLGPRRWITAAVLAIIAVSVAYTLLPFKFAGTLDCGAPLLGSDPGDYHNPAGLIEPERDCSNAGRSRLLVAATASLLAGAVGVATAMSRNVSRACLRGRHGECTEWWAAALGPAAQGFSCQCSCHRDSDGMSTAAPMEEAGAARS